MQKRITSRSFGHPERGHCVESDGGRIKHTGIMTPAVPVSLADLLASVPQETLDENEAIEREETARLQTRSEELGIPGNITLTRYIEGLEIEIRYLKDKLGW